MVGFFDKKAFQSRGIMMSTECQARCSTSPFGNVVGACVIYSHMALKVIRFFQLEALYPLFVSTSSIWSRTPEPSMPLASHLSPNTYLVMFKDCHSQDSMYMAAVHCPPPALCTKIEHFFCEVPALLKLACVDTSANEAELLASSVIFLLVPLGFILITYGYIGAAVLKIRSAKGRLKAFNTCASHLAVVSIFYDTAISTYLQPPSRYSQHRDKIVALFYTMVTPMLNPLIYTLRNKEVHRALQRALRRNMTAQGV
ncbi:olfactory receptor 2B2-like [Mauremys reevesii]|uniref:olfactory receptor 2B2-like n=1 Tax=Mauremys reevesii TaxID=260615 RepID=UPI00193FE4F9|nr:olfactory receptor 2B2-like [Mauremys reevesii]